MHFGRAREGKAPRSIPLLKNSILLRYHALLLAVYMVEQQNHEWENILAQLPCVKLVFVLCLCYVVLLCQVCCVVRIPLY